MSDTRANRSLEVLVILAVCAFLFFYGLGSFGLLGADEPRYAQIGGEMLARHDWIVPTLNGVPWLEKPPLLYWGEMASYAIFGVHDWAARVPVSLMTVLLVLATYGFVRRYLPGWQVHAALIATSLAAAVGFGRGASTDMPLTVCFTVAMFAWYEWYQGGPRRLLLVFYAASALGMLAKGPVAPFLAGALVVAFSMVARHEDRPAVRTILQTLWWPGILLFLVISLPWYIAVQMKTGDFFRVFILEHNLQRFGTNLYRHRQPFWYYLPVVIVGMMPWSAVFVAAIVDAFRQHGNRTPEADHARLRSFLLLWIAIPVVFFSLSQSKLPGYVLPSIPAGALLIVVYLSERKKALSAWLILVQAACCGALLAGVLLSPHFLLRVHLTTAAIVTATCVGVLTFAALALAIFRRGLRIAHAATLIPVLLSVAFIVKVAAPMIDATQSARLVAEAITRVRPSELPVVVFRVPRQTEYGLPYYGIPVTVTEQGSGDPKLPRGNYLLVTREGALPAFGSPATAEAGTFAPQKLVFYLVAQRQ